MVWCIEKLDKSICRLTVCAVIALLTVNIFDYLWALRQTRHCYRYLSVLHIIGYVASETLWRCSYLETFQDTRPVHPDITAKVRCTTMGWEYVCLTQSGSHFVLIPKQISADYVICSVYENVLKVHTQRKEFVVSLTKPTITVTSFLVT